MPHRSPPWCDSLATTFPNHTEERKRTREKEKEGKVSEPFAKESLQSIELNRSEKNYSTLHSTHRNVAPFLVGGMHTHFVPSADREERGGVVKGHRQRSVFIRHYIIHNR